MSGGGSERFGCWGLPTSCSHTGCTSMHDMHMAQAGTNSTPVPALFKSAVTLGPQLPTDVAALHSMIGALQGQLQVTTSVNFHLAASIAHLQAGQAPPTPITTTTTATAPLLCLHPDSKWVPSGRGAGSPEVFKEITKTNWHGRLGRTHMMDVDALPTTALAELDCFLRRKLQAVLPRGEKYSAPDADTIFASLAALGLRLEDRGAYADVPDTPEIKMQNVDMIRRGGNLVAWWYARGTYDEYWRGFALETLLELARYRGLFDEEGFLRVE